MSYQDLRTAGVHPLVRIVRVLVVVGLVAFAYEAWGTYRDYQNKVQQIEKAEHELQRLDSEVIDLKDWIHEMTTNPDFQKTVIRDSYPAVSKDEILFEVPQEAEQTRKPAK